MEDKAKLFQLENKFNILLAQNKVIKEEVNKHIRDIHK